MNARIVIVEGTSGVGKSTLIDAVLRKYVFEHKKIRSLMHLTQAHTYGPLAAAEDNLTLTKEMNQSHLLQIQKMLKWSVEAVEEEHKPKFFCMIDTLHITHCVRPGVIKWADVEACDFELHRLDCKLVFIKATPETIWQRGIQPRRNEQFITSYSQKFGKTPEDIHRYFIGEQERLEQLTRQSRLNTLILAAEDDFQTAVLNAYDFWLQ